MILLFGNAFGAQATAYQLTGGQIPLVTLVIGTQISGDVLHNAGLGYAMAMGDGRDHGASSIVALHRRSSGAPSGGCDDRRRPSHRSGRARDALELGRRVRGPTGRPRRVGFGAPWAWVVFIIGVSCTSSCRSSRRSSSRCGRGRRSRAYTNAFDDPEVLVAASATRSSSASSRSSLSIAAHRPDRVLGPAQGAPAPADRRVRDAAAVRRSRRSSSSSA